MGPVQFMFRSSNRNRQQLCSCSWRRHPSTPASTARHHLSLNADGNQLLDPFTTTTLMPNLSEDPPPFNANANHPPLPSTEGKVFSLKFSLIWCMYICSTDWLAVDFFFLFGMMDSTVMKWFQFVVIFWYLYAVLFSSVPWIRVFYFFLFSN